MYGKNTWKEELFTSGVCQDADYSVTAGHRSPGVGVPGRMHSLPWGVWRTPILTTAYLTKWIKSASWQTPNAG